MTHHVTKYISAYYLLFIMKFYLFEDEKLMGDELRRKINYGEKKITIF